MAAYARLKNEFTEDKKYHNLMSWLSYVSAVSGCRSDSGKWAKSQVVNQMWLTVIYYILNREIQEFLVKIKMLLLRSLEVFISSKEINLCR